MVTANPWPFLFPLTSHTAYALTPIHLFLLAFTHAHGIASFERIKRWELEAIENRSWT